MRSVFAYISAFHKTGFHFRYFMLIMVMVGLLIYLNYRYNLEVLLTTGGNCQWKQFTGYYLLYAVPFVSAFLFQYLFFKDIRWHKEPWFWFILLMAPAFFAIRVSFNWHNYIIDAIWSGDKLVFWQKSLSWVVRVFVVMIPVAITWWLKDKDKMPFYGSVPVKHLRPYLLMLLIMVPLIALASTQKDFLQMYPKAKFIQELDLANKKWYYLLYELCYGFDFVSIEFFFRGFLILSLMKICGPQCIIPVACFYCCIHFGKPMGEAISSFWGGLFLGIISYHTKSIWGGLLVHLGIAWLMEAGSWLAWYADH